MQLSVSFDNHLLEKLNVFLCKLYLLPQNKYNSITLPELKVIRSCNARSSHK